MSYQLNLKVPASAMKLFGDLANGCQFDSLTAKQALEIYLINAMSKEQCQGEDKFTSSDDCIVVKLKLRDSRLVRCMIKHENCAFNAHHVINAHIRKFLLDTTDLHNGGYLDIGRITESMQCKFDKMVNDHFNSMDLQY